MISRRIGYIASGLVAAVVVCDPSSPGGLPLAFEARPAQAQAVPGESIRGSWNGRWTDDRGRASGSVGVILAPGQAPGEVLGQFTFLVGADVRTARREGRVTGTALRFDLLGGGEIVLRTAGPDALVGEFRDARGALPAPSGHLQLSRVR